MDKSQELDRFRNLRFEDFGRMASDQSLKPFEKIGFPSKFREGFDKTILEDIKQKVNWDLTNSLVDIGCGCGDLTKLLIAESGQNGKQVLLVDSTEVLDQLENQPHVSKVAGRFPDNQEEVRRNGLVDVVICYSVFHYVFLEGNALDFIDSALSLLKVGGRFLVGDIPNVTKRNRFLLTPEGEAFHKDLMQTQDKPTVSHFDLEPGKIDDGFIMGLLSRYRNFGVETYLLPQPSTLPLSNSREDILFIKR
ncbi:MAG TPA: class I SAM-dependent methyltransferase [Cyclobacteriaceae bacterium]|jgi:2-polyprenyl-3-methyl-5-hydroxy-6-metoxy-1,4-benzoquinol methylase|nr:class I SAM-dependent methyltransferase [Cyclobacteriaceae bacterium]